MQPRAIKGLIKLILMLGKLIYEGIELIKKNKQKNRSKDKKEKLKLEEVSLSLKGLKEKLSNSLKVLKQLKMEETKVTIGDIAVAST